MADGATTNYSFLKPEVTGSIGTWGTKIDTALDSIDTEIKNRQTEAAAAAATANAALPKAGGTMTGRANLYTASTLRVDLGTLSTPTVLNLSNGESFSATIAQNLAFSFSNVPAAGTGATALVTGVVVRLTNSGAFAVTWPASVKWPSGVTPTLTASGTDLFVFITFDGGTIWLGSARQAFA